MSARTHLSEALALLPHLEHLSTDTARVRVGLHSMLALLKIDVEPVIVSLPRLPIDVLHKVRKNLEDAYWAAAYEAAVDLSARGDVIDEHVRKVVDTIVALGEVWHATRVLLRGMRRAVAQRAVA